MACRPTALLAIHWVVSIAVWNLSDVLAAAAEVSDVEPESGACLLQQSSHKSAAPIESVLQEPPVGNLELLQEGQQLSEHELKFRIEQRQRDYQRLTAELNRARDDLVSLSAQQHHAPQNGNSSHSEDVAVYVPVPYFVHHKAAPRFPSYLPSSIFGDALEPTYDVGNDGHGAEDGSDVSVEHEAEDGTADIHEAGGHPHGYVAILFLFSALIIGSLLQILLRHFLPVIPYTCALFLVGVFVSFIHYFNRAEYKIHWATWYLSIDMWQDINPHMLFYVFLPALLFGDVMKLKVQLVAACSAQIGLLAGPGVLLGTLLLALFGRYVLPYGWGWPICFVFGSILSATDPVAVVSLFNSLGVSPKLTMLVSGESLVNDGTAIVCFSLAMKVALGAKLVFWETVLFFLQMTVTAVFAGLVVGLLSVGLISFCSSEHEANAMIQVVVTICCAYLAFFLAESELSSSGVIATVSAGLVLAHSSWQLFISRETVQIVWEAIEFIGNTIIFFLAGLIFAGTMLEAKSLIGPLDFLWLGALYIAMFVIRALMMALFWVPLNMVGSHIQWQELVVVTWSGLRGAVSIAMGMIVNIEPGIHHRTQAQVMFHVGGLAALTLIVNAITIPALLRALGLVKSDELLNRIGSKISARIVKDVKHSRDAYFNNPKDTRFFGANQAQVTAMVPSLQRNEIEDTWYSSRPKTHNEVVANEWKLVPVFREVFLRVVQSHYWQGLEDGVTPRHFLVSRELLHSTERALENTWQALSDWDIIAKILNVHKSSPLERFLGHLAVMWPFKLIPLFSRHAPEFQTCLKIYAALSYIEAHTFARTEIPSNIGIDELDIRVQKQVFHESSEQMNKASMLIEGYSPWLVERCKSQMLARMLLRQQMGEIEHMEKGGFLTNQEAHFLEEPCVHALGEISSLPQSIWQERFGKQAALQDLRKLHSPAGTTSYQVPAAHAVDLPATLDPRSPYHVVQAPATLPPYGDPRFGAAHVVQATLDPRSPYHVVQAPATLPPHADPRGGHAVLSHRTIITTPPMGGPVHVLSDPGGPMLPSGHHSVGPVVVPPDDAGGTAA